MYEGYRIPKGAIVIGNIWSVGIDCAWKAERTSSLFSARAMLRDLSIYPDPEEFRPERFLATTSDGRTELDPSAHLPHTVFGFGRRYVSVSTVASVQIQTDLLTPAGLVRGATSLNKDSSRPSPPSSLLSTFLL